LRTFWIKLPDQYKILLYILFIVSGVLLFYLGMIQLQQMRISELTQQVHAEKKKAGLINDFVITHPDVERYIAGLENQALQADRMLPDNPQIQEFLLQIEASANVSGVNLLHIQPGISSYVGGHGEIPIEITTQGNFFQTITFLKKMEDCPRFNSVVRLSLQSQAGFIESNLVVVTYCVENAVAKKPLAQKK